MQFIIATGNAGKLEEFNRILLPLGINIIGIKDVNAHMLAPETGETFAQNAYIKALDIFKQTGIPVIADDSGLCVDYLGGAPGVYSARYQGEQTPYPDKMKAILQELDGVTAQKRGAQFVASICCILDEKTIITCEGVCKGRIGQAPKGDGGFGYDPIFMVGDSYDKSFAEITPAQKDSISHRAKALEELVQKLKTYMQK